MDFRCTHTGGNATVMERALILQVNTQAETRQLWSVLFRWSLPCLSDRNMLIFPMMNSCDDQWEDNLFPRAYLITFRTFGTWLHGDERHSVDVHDHLNMYRGPDRLPNQNLLDKMGSNMRQEPFIMNMQQRKIVDASIREVCKYKGYNLLAVNVRTNHAHAVVSALAKPELIADAFKKYATRKLRESCLIDADFRPWSRGRSRRYLWKDRHVAAAIEYVLYGQGDVPFEYDHETMPNGKKHAP